MKNLWIVVPAILVLASNNYSVDAFSPTPFAITTTTARATNKNVIALNIATTDNSDGAYAIDENRRWTMNLLVLGSAAVTVGALAVPYLAFFMPPRAAGAGGAVVAQDALGIDIIAVDYLNSKPAGDHSLVLGLQGDATYLLVKEDKTLESFGLNAVCTHLGCVVPWSPAIHKFQCPCHGSQYSPDGAVVRGPAPLPLALAHVSVDDAGKVVFSPWTETDFRTGEPGWWL